MPLDNTGLKLMIELVNIDLDIIVFRGKPNQQLANEKSYISL